MPRKSTASRQPRSTAQGAPELAVVVLDADLDLPVTDERTNKRSDAEPAARAAQLDEAFAAAVIATDFQLAQRCVAGEVAAWEQLHSDCHDGLLATARRLLRGRSSDPNLAEEIVAQVWYALVANDGELLLRFDPQRGARLMTFLRAIVRDLLSRHFRSEHRRMGRECESQLDKPQHHATELDQVEISLDEFLATLAPGERQFYDEYLLDLPEENDQSDGLTPTNVWQKTHRIYNKFRSFFGHDG